MTKSQEIVPNTDLTRKDAKWFILIVVIIISIITICNILREDINYQEHMGQQIFCKHIPNAFLIGESEKVLRLRTGTGFETSQKVDCTFDSTGTVQRVHPLFREETALFRAESE